MNVQPQMHKTEMYPQLLSESSSSSSQKPIIGSLSPSHPSSSTPFFHSKYSLLWLHHFYTHTSSPRWGRRCYSASDARSWRWAPGAVSHTHTHTQRASLHEEEHPAAVFMVALCRGRCSKQQAYRSCQGHRVSKPLQRERYCFLGNIFNEYPFKTRYSSRQK